MPAQKKEPLRSLAPTQRKLLVSVLDRDIALATYPALERWCGISGDAARHRVVRLVKQKVVRTWRYRDDHVVILPTLEICRALGWPKSLAQPGGTATLLPRLAMLDYWFMGNGERRKISRTLLEKKRPELTLNSRIPARYFFGEVPSLPGRDILQHVICDSATHPKRIIRKCQTAISRRIENKAWRELVYDAQQFAMIVVTTTKEKAAAIEEMARGRSFNHPLHCHIYPELIELLLVEP